MKLRDAGFDRSATWPSQIADATHLAPKLQPPCGRKTVSFAHKARATSARIAHPVQMRNVDMAPGLNAWHARRRRHRRQWLHRAILLTGVTGAGLYVIPAEVNPLVHVGILDVPRAPQFLPIPQVNLAIAVRPSDLPKHRPSLANARNTDQIEAAHVVGILPSAAFETSSPSATNTSDVSQDYNRSGSGDPVLAYIATSGEQTPTATLQASRKPIPAAAKPGPVKVEPDEDMAAVRKRVFNGDR